MSKVIIALVLFLLVGCNCVYQIKVNKDGSADVRHKTQLIDKDDILKKDPALVAEADNVGDDFGEKVTTSESMMVPYLDNEVIQGV
jgi:hypothetical protein